MKEARERVLDGRKARQPDIGPSAPSSELEPPPFQGLPSNRSLSAVLSTRLPAPTPECTIGEGYWMAEDGTSTFADAQELVSETLDVVAFMEEF